MNSKWQFFFFFHNSTFHFFFFFHEWELVANWVCRRQWLSFSHGDYLGYSINWASFIAGERNSNKLKETREYSDSQNENIQGVVQAGLNPGAQKCCQESVLPTSLSCLSLRWYHSPPPPPQALTHLGRERAADSWSNKEGRAVSFTIVAANIPGLTLIGWSWVMCPFLSQLIGRLESDKLVGGACAIGFLLKLEEWANLKT